MDKLSVFLHVVVALVFVGPVITFVSASPRAIRKGMERLPTVRFLHRNTKIYGWASLLIVLTGGFAGGVSKRHEMDELWISLSIALYIVVFVLLLIVMRLQDTAIERIEEGQTAVPQAAKIGMFGGIAGSLVIVILALMIWKPGA